MNPLITEARRLTDPRMTDLRFIVRPDNAREHLIKMANEMETLMLANKAANQLIAEAADEAQKLAEENAALREKLYKAGICADCGEEVIHDVDEPFASCSCGYGEDTTGPSVIQTLRMKLAALENNETQSQH